MPDFIALTRDDLLEFVERAALDGDYVAGLRLADAGYEVLAAHAACAARASQAAHRNYRNSFILSAVDGACAAGSVEVSRPSSAHGATVLKAGSVLLASRTGRRYIVLDDAGFGSSALGPITVRVRAESMGYEWDAPSAFTAANGEAVPGAIDTIERAVLDPPYSDPTLTVAQSNAITGGAPPALDMLGADRGLPRHEGEDAARYRQRLRRLPDTVTPGAMRRAINEAFAPYGASVDRYVEPGTLAFTGPYTAPRRDPNHPSYDPTRFVYNDPRPAHVGGRWLSSRTRRACFAVRVPRFPSLDEVGVTMTDPAVTRAAHFTRVGRRAVSAYSLPTRFGDGTLRAACYGGLDYAKRAVLRGLRDTLEEIKAGGVTVALIRERTAP